MYQHFKIVRDLSKYSYNKGSERIVVTQYNKGIRLEIEVLERKQPLDLSDSQCLISFVNSEGKLLLTDQCSGIQDTSLEPKSSLIYVIDERLTGVADTLQATVDLIHPSGCQSTIRPFSITILPHLLDSPPTFETDREEEDEEIVPPVTDEEDNKTEDEVIPPVVDDETEEEIDPPAADEISVVPNL